MGRKGKTEGGETDRQTDRDREKRRQGMSCGIFLDYPRMPRKIKPPPDRQTGEKQNKQKTPQTNSRRERKKKLWFNWLAPSQFLQKVGYVR